MNNYTLFKPRSNDPKASFSVSMRVSVLKAIEQFLDKENKSRSEFLQNAAIYYMRNRAEEWQKGKVEIEN